MAAHNKAERREIIKSLEAAVGADRLLHDKAERHVYGYDASVFRGRDILAVAFPESAQEVSALVKKARGFDLPVIVRGAGTGLTGGALPLQEALVIVCSRFNSILEVDIDNQVAVVEPGVVNQDLKTHLSRLGYDFTYLPDPGSQVVSTIGGNVGNNAGGMHCLKYGVTTNHILGLEMVLPEGDIVRLGGKTPNRPGCDLTGLFVGSEGTLAIITEITVRILPLPEKVVTQLVLFPTVSAAARAVSGIMATGILPAALELLDKKMMELIDRHIQIGYPPEAGASLIIEMDGLDDGMDGEVRRVAEICLANQALSLETAQSEEEAERLWLSRRSAYGTVARLSPTVYVIDCCVPRNLLPEAIEKLTAICEKRGLEVVNVAHAGDGNIHPLIPFDRNDPESQKNALAAHREILEMSVAMGGSITGEHGIGIEKQEEMGLMYSQDELEVMFFVKEALDARHLCNPRKIFPLSFFPETKSEADSLTTPPESTPSTGISSTGIPSAEILPTEIRLTGILPNKGKGVAGMAPSLAPAKLIESELGASVTSSALDAPVASSTPGTLEAYGLGELLPEVVAFPESPEQVAGLLSLARREGWGVVPWGIAPWGGRGGFQGGLPSRYHLALSMNRMARVLEHDPDNLTLTSEAGLALAEANRQMLPAHQFLPLGFTGEKDTAEGRATLGGIIASNRPAPKQLLYGGVRDRLLGLRVALPDGRLVRYGRKVIKNVAGYDMNKLFIGSQGMLGVIVEATFKLSALPDEEGCLLGEFKKIGGDAEAITAAAEVMASPLLPSFLLVLNNNAAQAIGSGLPFPGDIDGYYLLAGFEGRAAALRRQIKSGREIMISRGATRVETLEKLPVQAASRLTWPISEDSSRKQKAGEGLGLRVGVTPKELAPTMTRLEKAFAGMGLAVSLVADYSLGTILLGVTENLEGQEEALAAWIEREREDLRGGRGFVTVLSASAALKSRVQVWGVFEGEAKIMRLLKNRFDPDGILSPGRFL